MSKEVISVIGSTGNIETKIYRFDFIQKMVFVDYFPYYCINKTHCHHDCRKIICKTTCRGS